MQRLHTGTIIIPALAGRSSCTCTDTYSDNDAVNQAPLEHIQRGFLFVAPMDFSKLNGLIPAVIQDGVTREVLMVGFMNQAALDKTVETGFATFFSRTRNKLWTKGETSGNRLQVDRILVDCDDDTLLLLVTRLGDGNVCHTGERTCFFRPLEEGTMK